LRAVPGIGEWTVQYIALRALRDPDAFPATDVGLLRGAAEDTVRPTPAALVARAEAWRPWRAYAAQHLWCAAAAESATRARPDAGRARRDPNRGSSGQPFAVDLRPVRAAPLPSR